jgi:predicted nuclease with TOPRIM domain
MKTLKFYVIALSLVFVTASCVENSDKYKAVVEQLNSLEMEKQALDSNYNQTIALLNDIETGFSNINQNESQMKVNLKGVEGTTNRRDQIAAQMTAIKETMDQNKAKIEELRKLAAKRGSSNTQLTETINRLQNELDAKTQQIQLLLAELEQKNIKIEELSTTVSVQSKNIAEQQTVLEQQSSTIQGQDVNLNTVWYCVATPKTLKEANIVTTSGLFQPKKVMSNDFDKSAFTQIDLRNNTSIQTNSTRVKILSSHPEGSYTLESGIDKKITIQITNPSKFWSVSKYLVVQI